MLHPIQEVQLPSDICTYWPANPSFDPKRVLLQRMFFINEDKTKYVSVGFYPSRDYQTLVEFSAIQRGVQVPLSHRRTSRHVGGLSACDT